VFFTVQEIETQTNQCRQNQERYHYFIHWKVQDLGLAQSQVCDLSFFAFALFLAGFSYMVTIYFRTANLYFTTQWKGNVLLNSSSRILGLKWIALNRIT
jgi:hypothetical protein